MVFGVRELIESGFAFCLSIWLIAIRFPRFLGIPWWTAEYDELFEPDGQPYSVNVDPAFESLVLERLVDTTAKKKRAKAIEKWYAIRHQSPPDEITLRRIESRLCQMIQTSAVLGCARPWLSGSSVGVAGKSIPFRSRLVIGFERFLVHGYFPKVYCRSIIDHELTHCVQEVLDNAMTQRRWGVPTRLSRTGIELHAFLYGSPLVLFSFLFILALVLLGASKGLLFR